MDFLDPQKERRNHIVLIASYCLVGVAIALMSWMLLKQTDGYCLGRDGTVDRCGLIFVSSQPTGADIFINDKPQKFQTNGKVNVRSGTYAVRLAREGYSDWARTVTVIGGDVQRFDYPVLFPVDLKTTKAASFASQLSFMTQSPSRRWLVAAETAQPGQMQVFDLRNAQKPVTKPVLLQAGVVTAAESVQSWNVLEWSDDERHFLTQRFFTNGATQAQEYILLDRQDGTQARNMTKELALLPADQIQLFNKKQNQFYIYNTETKLLRTAQLGANPPNTLRLERVLAYKSYGDDAVMYVTDTPLGDKATPGSVSVVLQQGTRTSVLRRLPVAEKYLLDIAEFDGDWYVVAGSNALKGVYIFRNPLDAVLAKTTDIPSPFRFLKIMNPQHVAFSANAQFILAGRGTEHAVYDIDNEGVYHYTAPGPMDSPQDHVSWMDGHRLWYVSSGKLVVYDYDNLNRHVLQAALPQYGVYFAPNYLHGYTLTQQAGAAPSLEQTAFVIP
jgi:hypothetical protein